MIVFTSDCGRYLAVRSGDELRFDIHDARTGKLLCVSTFWSNRSTGTRLAFEAGSGDFGATFSCPRRPRWFYCRWVDCFKIELGKLAKLAERCGAQVVVGYKPDMNCWNHLGLRATPESMRALDAELRKRKIEFFNRIGKHGAWDIECPIKERTDLRPTKAQAELLARRAEG